MKIAICDDCVKDIEYLEQLIRASELCPSDIQIDAFACGEELLKNFLNYDAVFIDMKMNGKTGIETANEIRKRDKKVVLAFYSGYEVGAHKVLASEPFRYLMKDAGDEELSAVIDQVLNKIFDNSQTTSIEVCYKGIKVILELTDILYISTVGKGTMIWLTKKKANELGGSEVKDSDAVQRSSRSLKEYYKMLNKSGFAYASASYIVNIVKVRKHSKNELFLESGKALPLTRGKRKSYEEETVRFWKSKSKERGRLC